MQVSVRIKTSWMAGLNSLPDVSNDLTRGACLFSKQWKKIA